MSQGLTATEIVELYEIDLITYEEAREALAWVHPIFDRKQPDEPDCGVADCNKQSTDEPLQEFHMVISFNETPSGVESKVDRILRIVRDGE